VGFGQCDQIGQNFAHFLLNQFSPNQAVSAHGLLKLFQGFKSCLMYLIWVFKLSFEVNILSCLGYFFQNWAKFHLTFLVTLTLVAMLQNVLKQ
jgi:hypothetical protein